MHVLLHDKAETASQMLPEAETQILKRLKHVIVGRLDVDPEKLVPDVRLADVGVDSFSLVEMLFVAEEEFGIKLPFDGPAVTTVRDILNLIDRQLGVQRPA